MHACRDATIPVDAYIPGCPPRPGALFCGIPLAVGRLAEKVRKRKLGIDPRSTKPLSAMPNARLLMRVEGRNIYICSPEYMAQCARRLLWAGVKVIGTAAGPHPSTSADLILSTTELPQGRAPRCRELLGSRVTRLLRLSVY